MAAWKKHYVLMIGVFVLEVALIGLAVLMMQSIRPAYNTVDVLMMIAVGMIAGTIYVESMRWITEHEAKHSGHT
jgi:general stress protein CsbA